MIRFITRSNQELVHSHCKNLFRLQTFSSIFCSQDKPKNVYQHLKTAFSDNLYQFSFFSFRFIDKSMYFLRIILSQQSALNYLSKLYTCHTIPRAVHQQEDEKTIHAYIYQSDRSYCYTEFSNSVSREIHVILLKYSYACFRLLNFFIS